MKAPEVSFVVLNWNSGATIFQCLDSLAALKHRDMEVVVLDNGSTDGSTERLARRDDITLIRSASNLGYAGGQIAALPHCRGRYLALVNADAVLAADWLDVLLPLMRADDRVGATGGRLYRWVGRELSQTDYAAYSVVNPYTGEARTVNRDLGAPLEVSSLSAAAVLISRAAVDAVGYFDRRFFAYYEETDLFARMVRAGFRIVYQPSARAWHQVAASLGADSFRYNYLSSRNRLRFALRNFDRAYIPGLMWHWIRTETAIVLKLPLRHDVVRRARVAGAAWNVAHLPATLASRRSIVVQGTYNSVLHELQRPLISVVVTTHDDEADATVASVFRQAPPPHEVIVVEHGPEREGRERPWRDTSAVCVVSAGDVGVLAARNEGAACATGEWLLFLDVESELSDGCLAALHHALQRHGGPSIGFVYPRPLLGGTEGMAKVVPCYPSMRKPPDDCRGALLSSTAFEGVGGYALDVDDAAADQNLLSSMMQQGWCGLRVPQALMRHRLRHAPREREPEDGLEPTT